MATVLPLSATYASGICAGAALCVSLVAHPARLECGPALGRDLLVSVIRHGRGSFRGFVDDNRDTLSPVSPNIRSRPPGWG
jgi:hypothetical protein